MAKRIGKGRTITKDDLLDSARKATPEMAPAVTEPVDTPKEGEDLHERAMRHADEAWRQEFQNTMDGRDDQRFFAGGDGQWDVAALQARRADNRPALTINRLPGFVRQLTGDVRQNTPAVKVLPARGAASKEVAKIFNGLIRNIEEQSNAKTAYVKAIENAAITGIGAWRIETVYSSNDAFEQDIRIRRIVDPFAVLIDPMAREADKSDMRFAFVFQDIVKEEYERLYPDKSYDGMPYGVADNMGLTWRTMDTVRIAEYWFKESKKRTLQLLADGTVRYKDEAPKEEMTPVPVDAEREVDVVSVKCVWVNGKELLTKVYDWAGKYIPICVVTGEEVYFDGMCVRRGMIRDAKDPQRVYNYTRTAAVEAVAMQPKAPYIGTIAMFKGLESTWTNIGSKNLAYAAANPDPTMPGKLPERSQPAMASQGLDVQSQIANDDMKGVTGIYDASLGQKSNETSGRAILARQKEGDTGTYHFVDNLSDAIRHCGRILVDLIPKYYDSTRIVRTLEEDGSDEMVPINVPHPDGATDEQGQRIVLNDLSAGEYDVAVVSGPSYATKRQEAAASLTELIRGYPKLMDIAGDLLVGNMDIPEAEEISERIKRTMPPGVTDEHAPPPPPDPAMVAKAELDAAKADLTRAQADGQHIENTGTGIQLLQLLQQVHATMQSVEQQLQGGGQPQPGAPPMSPQGPPAGPPELEPMPDQPAGPMTPPGAPGLLELEPMGAAS